MADLIAEGADPQHRWRRRMPEGQRVLLGRSAGIWAVPWDERISRRHAEIVLQGGKLSVEKLPNALNPIFVRGSERPRFDIVAGEHFVIGKTKFTLTDEQAEVSIDVPQPLREQAYSAQYLQHVRFRNADQRIEVLSRLPDVISGANDDAELYVRLVNLLLAGIGRAVAVALVEVNLRPEQGHPIRVLHWDRRYASSGTFQPSQRLILRTAQRRQSMLHVWGVSEMDSSITALTIGAERFDWAFCVPTRDADPCLAIYVAGAFSDDPAQGATPSDPTDLRDDLKFTELVASIVTSLRQTQHLQRRQASLSQFFAPAVLDALTEQDDPETVLAPRETNVSVLFCDLRGFSLNAEQSRDDLLGLLERVSAALGVMTHHILEEGGVVGDYQGDSAMGFWGWPLEQQDAVERAARAALSIRRHFDAVARDPEDPLSDFRVGVGIASGTAVAGKIGTLEQVKVTVFGPVVNLASRLEGMTRILHVPILIDQTTTKHIVEHVPRDVARVRRLAVVQPFGMDRPVAVAELLPPEGESTLSDQNITDYEAALDALLEGHWDESYRLLHKVPPDDVAKDFLTVYIARHNRQPPPDWAGFIPLSSK